MVVEQILYPNAVFLNRGNHESRQQNRVMGFEREVFTKYPGQSGRVLLTAFSNLFDQIPLAALVHQKIFVVHGGLFRQDGVTFDHIRSLDRRREPPLHSDQFQDQVFEAMLWSDPRPIHGRKLSQRGAGVEFGQEVTFEFLKKNRVALIVRSHECVHEGFELAHSGRLITLFSASYYCGLQTNKGAFLSVGPDLQPEIQQFYAASLAEATWEVPELLQNKRLEDENVKMIIERLVDCKHSLLWQFSICDTEKTGRISRLDWSKSLRLVLELDIPFLLYQNRLAELEPDGTINYSKFLDRYRVELAAGAVEAMDRWQEAVISKICEKMFVALGAGDVNEAFRRFDVDSNGYIEYHEFVSTLRSLNLNLSEQQIYELMAGLDTDRDSRIDPR
jgi:Ca2+-binding EF-hand superfamily protein/diadenosine tetraphosphatase ApaH/serine/threonine PP2A family protein phosphatase